MCGEEPRNLVHFLEISRPSVQNIPPAPLPTGSHCPPVNYIKCRGWRVLSVSVPTGCGGFST